jgi:diphthamide biosynthesis protein 7
MEVSASSYEFDTVLQADSIESHHAGLFACGTYSLRNDEASGRRWREGRIHLVDLDAPVFGPVHSVSCGGVLDLKWGGDLLASVESEAGFGLYRLEGLKLAEQLRGKLDRKIRSFCNQAPESLINLSLDWIGNTQRLAMSHDDGSLSLWDVGEASMTNLEWWGAHDNEAWIVAAHKSEFSVLWSGADDGFLRGWDSRVGLGRRKNTFEVKGDAGVTSILQDVHDGHLWAVGGYDEELRLFDDRNPKTPVAKLSDLGGGVWRIKFGAQKFLFLVLR